MKINKTALFILGAASILGAAWLIRRRRAEIPGLRNWQPSLERRYGPIKAGQIIAAVRQHLTSLVKETPAPENQALRWHLVGNILPGLALYRVLLEEHAGDRAAALSSVDEAFHAKALGRTRLVFAPLHVLPNPFRLFKLVFPQVMDQFPPEGWEITYLEDSADRIAFNMTRCFYLNTLSDLGAPELTASFCKNDEYMAESFPPDIRFTRQHTLGRGDELCDFQYCHVK